MEPKSQVVLIGQWENSYDSLMTINYHLPNGLFTGTYSSTTGASGKYLLVGYAPKNASGNYPVSLAIYWRSIEGGESNPTWNWVSIMSGQMITDDKSTSPHMELLHGMVASTDYSDISIHSPGVYTETLIFQQKEGKPTFPPSLEEGESIIHELNSNWRNADSSSFFQSLSLNTFDTAFIEGKIDTPTGAFDIAGLYDIDATSSILESVALSGLITYSNNIESTISLGGWLSEDRNELRLIVYKSIAVPNSSKYASVNVIGTERFIKD